MFKITDKNLRAENRGHGIVALHVTGPVKDDRDIVRATRTYARTFLGVDGRPVSSGAAYHGDGTVTVQEIFCTQPLTPPTF